MRKIALVGALSLAGACHASFELVIVSGYDGTESRWRVQRYDGVSGAYFGEIGARMWNAAPLGLATDPTTSTLYVTESAGAVVMFNYDTGAYLGEWLPGFQTQGWQGQGAGGTFLWAESPEHARVGEVDRTGGTLGFYDLPTWTLSSAYASTGYVYAHDFNTHSLVWWRSGAYGQAPAGSYSVEAQIGSLTSVGMATSGRTLAMTYYGGQSGVLVARLASGGGVSRVDRVGHDDGHSLGLAFGHSDMAYVTTFQSASGNIVRRLNTSTLAWRGWFSTGNVQPHAITVVAAPEPSAWLALGLAVGSWVGARRRRPPP